MGLLSNKIDLEQLNSSDHIYSCRDAYIYAHHVRSKKNNITLEIAFVILRKRFMSLSSKQGMENTRWIFDDAGLDFGIDQVLATKTAGTIRIGLDIGRGIGTFAARLREGNVTTITRTLNLDGPFNNFIASKGLNTDAS